MKTIKLPGLALFVLAIFSSCQKAKEVRISDPKTKIVGTWKGKYGYGFETQTEAYLFILREDGKMEAYDGDIISGKTAMGTYGLEGNLFTATYLRPDGDLIIIEADLNAELNRLSGTWIAPYRGGTFLLNQQ